VWGLGPGGGARFPLNGPGLWLGPPLLPLHPGTRLCGSLAGNRRGLDLALGAGFKAPLPGRGIHSALLCAGMRLRDPLARRGIHAALLAFLAGFRGALAWRGVHPPVGLRVGEGFPAPIRGADVKVAFPGNNSFG